MYHGIINVYKEAGFTSHDVVAKLRGICKQKKIGHTGTLDPDAVGVLPVCLGSGTKLCDMLTGETKEYIAGFRLGMDRYTGYFRKDSGGKGSPCLCGAGKGDAFSFCGRAAAGSTDVFCT